MTERERNRERQREIEEEGERERERGYLFCSHFSSLLLLSFLLLSRHLDILYNTLVQVYGDKLLR